VRRDKAALSSGCEPHPATAPAGIARAGHLNVGEKHVVVDFQHFQSGVGVLGFDDAKAAIFKQTNSVQAFSGANPI
jgi:hypothetical protein